MAHATELVAQYRFAVRDLWNRYFWGNEHFWDAVSIRDLAEVLVPLFQGLVAKRLETGGEPSTAIFGSAYRAVPSLVFGQLSLIYVERGFENKPGQCWNKLDSPFKQADLELSITELFDWSDCGFRDFRYFRTRIDKFPQAPDLMGREALVEVLEVDVLWNPAQCR